MSCLTDFASKKSAYSRRVLGRRALGNRAPVFLGFASKKQVPPLPCRRRMEGVAGWRGGVWVGWLAGWLDGWLAGWLKGKAFGFDI